MYLLWLSNQHHSQDPCKKTILSWQSEANSLDMLVCALTCTVYCGTSCMGGNVLQIMSNQLNFWAPYQSQRTEEHVISYLLMLFLKYFFFFLNYISFTVSIWMLCEHVEFWEKRDWINLVTRQNLPWKMDHVSSPLVDKCQLATWWWCVTSMMYTGCFLCMLTFFSSHLGLRFRR